MPQIIGRRMVGREASWHAGELFAAHRSKELSKLAPIDDTAEGPGIFRNVFPDGREVFGKGHVETATDEQFRGRQVEVKRRALMFAKARPGKDTRDVSLVRGFIL